MKTKIAISAVVFLLMLVSSAVAVPSVFHLNDGYDITTDHHGKNVLPGALVTAMAATTDSNVESITFVWRFPNGTASFTDSEVPVVSDGMWTNNTGTFNIFVANSSFIIPAVFGDWSVWATFNGPGGHLQGQDSDIIAIRATSFNVIPEVPLGTAVILLSMFGALGIFALKKRRTTVDIAPAKT